MKFLIIEDEMSASARLKRMILAIRPEATCLAELRGVEDALQWLQENGQGDIDAAFVDIQLSDGLSFELFDLVEVMFPVIFTTAYDHYAIQVFQVHTIDYLLKPIKRDQLHDALIKLDKYGKHINFHAVREAIAEIPATPRQRFMVKSGRSIRVVNVSDASYFISQNKISYVVCFDGKRYAMDHTLDQLEEMLSAHDFIRANRQCIVGIQGIEEVQTHSRSRLKLKLLPAAPQEVVVSTEKAAVFKDWLQGKTP